MYQECVPRYHYLNNTCGYRQHCKSWCSSVCEDLWWVRRLMIRMRTVTDRSNRRSELFIPSQYRQQPELNKNHQTARCGHNAVSSMWTGMACWLAQGQCGLSSGGRVSLVIRNTGCRNTKVPHVLAKQRQPPCFCRLLCLTRFSSQVESVRLIGHWCQIF